MEANLRIGVYLLALSDSGIVPSIADDELPVRIDVDTIELVLHFCWTSTFQ